MRETNFIKQNKEEWKELERTLQLGKKDPDKLNDLFVKITDDLSYSRTFYPNRSVRVYLNSLAQQVFYSIYKNKKTTTRRFLSFWTDELPQIMYESRKDLYIAFTIFMFAVFIGAFSTAMNPEFPRVILGDMYVEMTIENIQNGDPMAVYKGDNELFMSLAITWNNLRVAFLTFVAGVFWGIGTIGILISNGIMLGSFQYFFYQQDSAVFQESVLTIWMHGALEISSIVLAGAAGMALARGLIFPGTLSRLQAFQLSAKRGIKIMLGITPIFIIAGFIEGFITRHTDVNDFVRGIFIILCFAFVLFYYVIYPRMKAKRGFTSNLNEVRLPPTKNTPINFGKIKTNADIFNDIFPFYKKHLGQLLRPALLGIPLYLGAIFLIYGTALKDLLIYNNWSIMSIQTWDVHVYNVGEVLNNPDIPLLGGLNILLFSTIVYGIYWVFIQQYEEQSKGYTTDKKWLFHAGNWIKVAMIIGLIQYLQYTIPTLAVILVSPFLLFWLTVMVLDNRNVFSSIPRTIVLLRTGFFQTVGIFWLTFFMGYVFTFIANSDFIWFLLDVVGWNIADRGDSLLTTLSILVTGVYLLSFSLLAPLFIVGKSILFYSLKEIRDADALEERISAIGIKRQAYGIERE